MIYHILNGDALVDRFRASELSGIIAVARECLIEGNLSGTTLTEFWKNRADYIESAYYESRQNYFERVVPEYQKIMAATDHSEFNLWFGYDLFCQVNMWFVLSILKELSVKKEIYIVYPSYLKSIDRWKDFGHATPKDLRQCFKDRIAANDFDINLAYELWHSYKNGKLDRMEDLSKVHSKCFPYLQEVCTAHIERFPGNALKGRPERVIEEILKNSTTDFYSVFEEFYKREGVYGFGDLQVKHIYDKIMKQP